MRAEVLLDRDSVEIRLLSHIVENIGPGDTAVEAHDGVRSDEEQEILVVLLPDAVPDPIDEKRAWVPRTVVIELSHADVAHRAVFRPSRPITMKKA